MADSIAVLNLGSQRISGALFGKTGGGDLILKRYEVVEMAGDPTVDSSRLPLLKVAIEELAEKLRIKKQAVWYAIAGHSVFTRFVKLPPVKPEKVTQIVEFEARQNVPFPINEVTWDYEVVSPPDGGEVEVVLVAMKSDALNELNDQVIEGGLNTAGVDLAPLALFNAFRYSYPDVDEPSVIIDLGARSTNLVFVDGEKFFTRNILVGGASVSTAIAKEFQISFAEAEQQKLAQGFVAQGGAVEEHPDAGIAALSKVMRNAMTRLHGEILRTINYYRSQQGGASPKRVFLAGGGASMALAVEFFQEKLKLPVEILNPLRGVQLDRSVNSEASQQDAPAMGELVGLALRAAGGCPCEVELVPDALASARDAGKRAPSLILAGLCVMAALGAGIMYFKNIERVTQDQIAVMQGENTRLSNLSKQIREIEAEQAKLQGKSLQLEKTVNDRSYWVRLLSELNNKFENDLIWLTVVEPLKDGKSVTPVLFTAADGTTPSASAGSSDAKAANPAQPVYELQINGLYRKNDEGEQVVYRYAAALAKSEFFSVEKFDEKRSEYVSADSGVEEERYAYKFKIKLPLKEPIQFK